MSRARGDKMADELVSKTILAYEVKNVEQVVRSTETVKASMKGIGAEVSKLGPTADRANRELLDHFSSSKKNVDAAKESVAAYRRELEQVDRSTPKQSVLQSVDKFGSIGSQILGGIGGSAGSGLGQTANVLGDIAGAFTNLNPIMLGVTAVTSGVALVLNQQREAEERLKVSTQATIDLIQREAEIRQQTAGVIATGSSATAQAKITEAETQRDALLTGQYQDTINKMQAYVDEKLAPEAARQAENNLYNMGVEFNAPGRDRLLTEETARVQEQLIASDPMLKQLSGTLVDYNKQLDVFQKQINDLKTTGLPGAQILEALNRPLEDQRKLRDLETKSSADLVKQRNADASDLVQINKTVTATETEIAKARADGNDTLAEVLTNQNVKNRADAEALQRELNLIAIAMPQARANEAVAEASKQATQALKDMATASANITAQAAKVADAEKAVTAERTRDTQAIAQIESDLADKRTEINEKAAAEEKRILEEANLQAAKLGEDYGVEKVRAQEDLQRELRRLDKQQGNAEQNRDAVQFAAIKDQAADEKEQASVAQRRRKEDYERQIRDLAAATQRQLQTTRAGKENELKLAQKAADASLQLEAQKFNAEIQLRQQALDAMKAQYEMFLSQLQGAAAQTGRQVLIPQTSMQTIAQLVAQGILPPSAMFTANANGVTVSSRAAGGMTQGLTLVNDGTNSLRGTESALTDRRQLIYFDKPTRILNARQTEQVAREGHQFVFPITVGSSKRQIMKLIEQKLDVVFDLVG